MPVEVLKILKDFGTQKDYMCFLEQTRWGDKRICPGCGSGRVRRKKGGKNRQNGLRCISCELNYNVTVGTVFHGTHLSLKSWFDIVYFMFSSEKRLGCRAISKLTGIYYCTVWRIQKKIRAEMLSEKPGLLKKIIGWTDNTYNIFMED